METRTIAIIAHVDHGKTTLTDALMRETGMFVEGMSMDQNTLEKERGITIYAKNSALFYNNTKINIVDTPGHADFGSEVERVLRSVDSVLLLVDAQEGPMPQTRFVLKKSLELGHKPIVVINKIDKPAANAHHVESEVLGLFLELGATEEQATFPVVYAIGRDGVAMTSLDAPRDNLKPLLDTILAHVPPAESGGEVLRAQPFNLGYDSYLGRMAIARVYDGSITKGQKVWRRNGSETTEHTITALFVFEGITRKEVEKADAGEIVMIAGIPEIGIGDTVCGSPSSELLPSIAVDEPTITLSFLVNNSPFAGREGKFVTSRQIRERLERELEVNVGLAVDFALPDRFTVSGRGELHVAILLETMRREGYEMQVSQPQVITKEEGGVTVEPFEEVTVDVPSENQGTVIEKLGTRGATMTQMAMDGDRVRMVFEGPTRGLLGYRNQFVVDTKGEGIFASRVIGFKACAGEVKTRNVGSMVSMITGKTSAYSLDNLQTRGTLYIGAGVDVYEGMVIGDTAKGEELSVNPVKGKNLTNVRSSGTDDAIFLVPPRELTIERGLEIMQDDEYLEITPLSVRLRKQFLTESERAKSKRQGA